MRKNEKLELKKEKDELIKHFQWGDKSLVCEMANVDKSIFHRWYVGEIKDSSIEPYIRKLAEKRKIEFEKKFQKF